MGFLQHICTIGYRLGEGRRGYRDFGLPLTDDWHLFNESATDVLMSGAQVNVAWVITQPLP